MQRKQNRRRNLLQPRALETLENRNHLSMTFDTGINYNVAGPATSAAVGDFNGDGKRDVATANSTNNSVSVLLGSGTGTFGAAATMSVGQRPLSVAVGDFNGDGRQDLVSANRDGNDVSVRLGNGNGTFGATASFAIGTGATQPSFVRVGDFNNDGRQDLVTANSGSANVSVLLGTGTGTFGAATTFNANAGVAGSPTSVSIADFNNDGKQDLVTANGTANNRVCVLLGTGTGSFGAGASFASGFGCVSVDTGDFNRDGKQDIATANTSAGTVGVLLGNGNGTFGIVEHYIPPDVTPAFVTVGDFNADGKLDIATANTSSNNLCVFSGTGTGTFDLGAFADPAGHSTAVAVGDFNADGKPDLVSANSTDSNNIGVVLNISDLVPFGGFGAAVNYPITNGGPIVTAVGDFNNDGKPDLVAADSSNDSVSVRLGTGTGAFGAATAFAAGNNPQSVAVLDFNSDGKQDLVTANFDGDNLSLLLGTGTGTFGAPVFYTVGDGARSVAVGDFDGNGRPDVAIANELGDNVSVMLGTGTFFATLVNNNVGDAPVFVSVGDFNRDGRQDLVTSNANSSNVSVLLGNGNGTFGTATPFAVASGPFSVAVGDFNADGRQDLATANLSTDNVSVLLGNGNGTFQGQVTYPAGDGAASVAVGDFNRDGKRDLVTANFFASTFSVLAGNGNGTFGAAAPFATAGGPLSLTTGDFNRDGKQDLVTASPFNSNVAVLLNNTAPSVAVPIFDQTLSGPGILSYTVPEETFIDDEGNTLTYSAKLTNGAALPGWLSFNPATRIFSGNPRPSDVSPLQIRVSVNDGNGGSAFDDFDLTLNNVADAYVVNTLVDENNGSADPGQGTGTSLREAINAANTSTESTPTIAFEASLTSGGPATITLGGTELVLNHSLAITGPGANLLSITGNNASRVINVSGGGPVSISAITITGGNANGGGGISSGQTTLNLDAVHVTGNTSTSFGGGLASLGGGTITINNSTFSNNTAANEGGAIEQQGVSGSPAVMTLTNCTITGNVANGAGFGAISNVASGASATLTVRNCTMAGNTGSASFGGGILNAVNSGSATASYVNTIFANTGPNIVNLGGTVTSLGHNLSSDGTGNLSATGDLPNRNPLLGTLGQFGGPTPTMPLSTNSPAINAGVAITGITADQRGITRPQGSAPDIGAFERQATNAALTGLSYDFETRQAVTFDFDGDASVIFSRSSYGIENLTSGQTLPADTGQFAFNSDGRHATLVLTNLLPDANYRVLSPARSGVGVALDFFVFAGDANRDRSVNISDFSILASRFNLAGTFSQGDFNYNGTTEIGDFSILASKFNTNLSVAGSVPVGAMNPVRTNTSGSAFASPTPNNWPRGPFGDRVIDEEFVAIV